MWHNDIDEPVRTILGECSLTKGSKVKRTLLNLGFVGVLVSGGWARGGLATQANAGGQNLDIAKGREIDSPDKQYTARVTVSVFFRNPDGSVGETNDEVVIV